MTQPPVITDLATKLAAIVSPGLPRDVQQRKDLHLYLMGVHGMTEQAALIAMSQMDRSGRTRCEMDMARRRASIKRHQFDYDPFKRDLPSVQGGRR